MNCEVLKLFSRMTIHKVTSTSLRNFHLHVALPFNVSNILFAEPLKKKKKMDPAIFRAREERKRRKLEKQIRRLEKHAKQLKPILEMTQQASLAKEAEKRKREGIELTFEESEERAILLKDWARYRAAENKIDMENLKELIKAQKKVINNLKNISEHLYTEAVQIDPTVLPYSAMGPTRTPAVTNYDSPDGEYFNITKKYDGE